MSPSKMDFKVVPTRNVERLKFTEYLHFCNHDDALQEQDQSQSIRKKVLSLAADDSVRSRSYETMCHGSGSSHHPTRAI